MKKIGNVCIATYKDSIHWNKLAIHVAPSIWVGYAEIPNFQPQN